MAEEILSIFESSTDEKEPSEQVDDSPISLDIEEDSEEGAFLELGDSYSDLDPESHRTNTHFTQSGFFKLGVVSSAVMLATFLVILFLRASSNVKTAKTPEEEPVVKKEFVDDSGRAQDIKTGLASTRLRRQEAAKRLAEANKNKIKGGRKGQIKPKPPTRTAARTTPARTTPVRIGRDPTPVARPPSRPIPRVRPRPIQAQRPAPKPAPVAKAPAPKPVDRSPVSGGSLPESTSSESDRTSPTQFVSSEVSEEDLVVNYSSTQSPELSTQTSAFVQGRELDVIPSGTTIKAKIQSEALLADQASFHAVTTSDSQGIPKGSKLTVQVTSFEENGYFEAELINVNGLSIPQGSTRITAGGGKLLRAKAPGGGNGFFKGIGKTLLNAGADLAQDTISDQLGNRSAVNDVANEILVLPESSFSSSSRRDSFRSSSEDQSRVRIPKGGISISFNQDTFISR